ncbi:MAG: carbamoyltransferase HypF, partial [Bryobacteraceae bacterium]
CDPYAFPVTKDGLDFRPLLSAVMRDRLSGRERGEIARSFHAAIAQGLWQAARQLCEAHSIDLVVLSGGVFQNELLLSEIKSRADQSGIEIWTNAAVPANDGGISLWQAAIAALKP